MLMAGVGWLALQLLVSARVATHNGRSPLQGVVEALCYFTMLTNTLVRLIATARLAGSRASALLTTSGTAAPGAVYIWSWV